MLIPSVRHFAGCLRAGAVLLSVALSAARASAQDTTPPTITASQPDSSSFTNPSLPLTFQWHDDTRLMAHGFTVALNGNDVTSQFTYTPHPGGAPEATSTGTLFLTPGENTIAVELWDQAENLYSKTYIYTYTNVTPPAAAPLPEATSGATPSTRDIVEALYRLAMEREGDAPGIAGWMTWYSNGGGTVKQMLRNFVTSGEYQANFVTGKTPEQVVAGVYRHVYAREAEPNEISRWAPVAASQGWVAVVDGLLNDWSYGEWFGDHAVPGTPVTAWDATRAPIVLEPGSATANVDRGLCLTIAAGPGAAYECGDLRVVHGLPAIRSLNKARSPTLLYNSQLATPTPLVAARVVLPTNLGTPTQVTATLKVGPRWDQLAQAGPTRTWPGSQWTPGAARRIVLAYDAQGETTGLREYALEVVATYPGESTQRWVMRGSLAVVNRLSSPFGAGWWLAGLEQIQCIECSARSRILWVGGDGSTRVYVPASVANTWVAPRADGVPDTLRSSTYNGAALYTRNEPGGARVFYNIQGQHTATMNRLGQVTRFVYSGTRLSEVRVPRAQATDSVASYRFEYNGPNTTLTRVTAPDLSNVAGRPTVLEHLFGDERITTIIDPDGSVVRFNVNHYIPARGRYTMRRDRRGTETYYNYDDGGKMARIDTDMRGTGANTTTYLAAQETRGLVGAPLVVKNAYTTLDGPRHDVVAVTRIWVDRFGAPWRTVDAGGRETVLTRSDARFPALVTRMDGAVDSLGARRTTSASYTARGNLAAHTDWSTSEMRLVINPQNGQTSNQTIFATTRYAYEDTAWPDFATRVTRPTGESTQTAYFPNGNRAWQQPGADVQRRVRFGYNALGLMESVTLPAINGQVPVERYEYDTSWNVNATISTGGFRTTIRNDSFGRTWQVESPIDGIHKQVATTQFYANSDRVEVSTTSAPLLYSSNPEALQSVTVHNWYDGEGAPLRVDRSSNPDWNNTGAITLRWERDAAGRVLAEFAPDGTPNVLTDNPVERMEYDAAGNVTKIHTRRMSASNVPLTITNTYDQLNRVLTRTTEGVAYAPRHMGIPNERHSATESALENVDYPRYPNVTTGGYEIATEVATFAYDTVGRLVAADNPDARVARAYNLNGTLKTETQRINTLARNDFTKHVYEVGYSYDLSGRRIEVRHPEQLAPSSTQRTTGYAYDPLTGAMDVVTNALGNTFRYGFNVRGDLESLQRPGGISERYMYDADGNLNQHDVRNQSTADNRFADPYLRGTAFTYDQRGKVQFTRNNWGTRDTLNALYSGLGQVVGGGTRSYAFGSRGACLNATLRTRQYEAFAYDALGNTVQSLETDTLTDSCGGHTVNRNLRGWKYEYGTGRLANTENDHQRDTTYYDAAGNAEFATQTWYSPTASSSLKDNASYYSVDGKLRAADSRSVEKANSDYSPFSSTFEEYRYDALGRRVWVRARRYCEHDRMNLNGECNLDKVRRTVWDGDSELYEIQMPDTATYREEDVLTVDLPLTSEGGGIPVDPNPFFGRVGYTHGLGTDEPLDVIRLGYGDMIGDGGTVFTRRSVSPFALMPLWNSRGQADLGVFADGAGKKCEGTGTARRCVYISWPGNWFAYRRSEFRPSFWHGTLIEDKRDAAGTHYRRNRYYDPSTGRFTQEDPIGLAGGLNAYGFANGDPVSYSDPYGLCPLPPTDCPVGYFTARLGASGAIVGGLIGASGGLVVAAPTGELASPLTVPVGIATGALAGAKAGVFVGSAIDVAVQIAPRVDDAAMAMGRLGRAVRRVIGTATIYIGATSPVPTTDSAGGAEPGRTTETPQEQGRRPRKEEEGERPPPKP